MPPPSKKHFRSHSELPEIGQTLQRNQVRFEPVNDEYQATVITDKLDSEANMLSNRGLSEFQEDHLKEEDVATRNLPVLFDNDQAEQMQSE